MALYYCPKCGKTNFDDFEYTNVLVVLILSFLIVVFAGSHGFIRVVLDGINILSLLAIIVSLINIVVIFCIFWKDLFKFSKKCEHCKSKIVGIETFSTFMVLFNFISAFAFALCILAINFYPHDFPETYIYCFLALYIMTFVCCFLLPVIHLHQLKICQTLYPEHPPVCEVSTSKELTTKNGKRFV